MRRVWQIHFHQTNENYSRFRLLRRRQKRFLQIDLPKCVHVHTSHDKRYGATGHRLRRPIECSKCRNQNEKSTMGVFMNRIPGKRWTCERWRFWDGHDIRNTIRWRYNEFMEWYRHTGVLRQASRVPVDRFSKIVKRKFFISFFPHALSISKLNTIHCAVI